jgi:hypothetical protein
MEDVLNALTEGRDFCGLNLNVVGLKNAGELRQ